MEKLEFRFIRGFFIVVFSVVFFILSTNTANATSLIWSESVRVTDNPISSQPRIYPTNNIRDPKIAVDPSGNAYAVWTDTRDGAVLYSSFRPAGGVWGPNEKVDNNGRMVEGFAPGLAVDTHGNAYAVWTDNRNYETWNYDIYFAYRPFGGNWQTSVRLTNNGTSNIPSIAVDSFGNVYVVWFDAGKSLLFTYKTPLGNWEPVIAVNDSWVNYRGYSSITATPDGEVYATWMDSRNNKLDIYYAYRLPNGEWSANELVSNYTNPPPGPFTDSMPDIAVGSNKTIHIIWDNYKICDGSPCHSEYYTNKPVNGAWSGPVLIGLGGQYPVMAIAYFNNIYGMWWPHDIAIDGQGNVYGVWKDGSSGQNELYFSLGTNPDSIFPTSEVTLNGTLGTNNWYTSDVGLTLLQQIMLADPVLKKSIM